jgi:hypothetical protein
MRIMFTSLRLVLELFSGRPLFRISVDKLAIEFPGNTPSADEFRVYLMSMS